MVVVVSKNRLDAMLSGLRKGLNDQRPGASIDINDDMSSAFVSAYFFSLGVKFHTSGMSVFGAREFLKDAEWATDFCESVNKLNFVLSWDYTDCDPAIKSNDDYADLCSWYFKKVVDRDDDAIIESLISNSVYVEDREAFRIKDVG